MRFVFFNPWLPLSSLHSPTPPPPPVQRRVSSPRRLHTSVGGWGSGARRDFLVLLTLLGSLAAFASFASFCASYPLKAFSNNCNKRNGWTPQSEIGFSKHKEFRTSQMDRMGIKFVARHLELGFWRRVNANLRLKNLIYSCICLPIDCLF